jgi:hypothetical protein
VPCDLGALQFNFIELRDDLSGFGSLQYNFIELQDDLSGSGSLQLTLLNYVTI